jgi:hypothetical protein
MSLLKSILFPPGYSNLSLRPSTKELSHHRTNNHEPKKFLRKVIEYVQELMANSLSIFNNVQPYRYTNIGILVFYYNIL